jgi:hypothetical protein
LGRAQTARREVITPPDWAGRCVGVALIGLTLAIGLQPVSDPGVWWELSRGRAVLDGTLIPTRMLCAGPVVTDADWAGGVPWLLIFLAGGPTAFTLVRLTSVALIALVGWRSAGSLGERALLTTTLMLGLAPAFAPGDRWADTLAGLSLLWIWQTTSLRRVAWQIVLLGILWGNLGPRAALLLLFAVTVGWHRRSLSTGLMICGAAAIGLSLSPRGPLGLWDSCRMLAPWLQLTPGELFASDWPPLWGTTETAAGFGWASFSILVAGRLWSRAPSVRSECAAAWCLLQTAVVWNAGLIPVLLPWMWAIHPGSSAPLQRRRWEAVTVSLGLWGLACLQAAGGWPGQTTRLGWGIAETLEPRQLADAIPPSARGTIFAPNLHTAGIGAWVAPPNLKIWQTPRQALLTGTWRAERDRMNELRTGWDLQHPRVDGTSGGWWLPLLDRQTTLILIPAEDRRTLQSFEPELWKPLAIDAPIIPYAFSGTPWATPGILQALQQREFVEAGPWQYQPSTPWGNDWCVDLWGGLTGQPDLQPIRRQIEIFSSLGLPIAAARMVHGMRRVAPERFALELAEVQRSLGEVERKWLGQSPRFRQQVRARLLGMSIKVESIPGESTPGESTPVDANLAACVKAYIHSGPQAAATEWPAEDPWRPFWQYRLAAEASDVVAARTALLALQRADDPLRQGLARDLLDLLPAGGTP